MENGITITIELEKIKSGFQNAANEIFKSSYSNPIKELLEKSIKEKEGELKKIVDSIISESLGNPSFKEQISAVVIQRIVAAALQK